MGRRCGANKRPQFLLRFLSVLRRLEMGIELGKFCLILDGEASHHVIGLFGDVCLELTFGQHRRFSDIDEVVFDAADPSRYLRPGMAASNHLLLGKEYVVANEVANGSIGPNRGPFVLNEVGERIFLR